MKQPRKVSLISVQDYPKSRYSAFWEIGVTGNDSEGYQWRARIVSYTPVGWEWKGKTHKERPIDAPVPAYPSDAHLARQADYERMTEEQQRDERARQDAFRAACAAVHEAHPKPVYVIEETVGAESPRDAADTAAQQWVLDRMPQFQRKGGGTLGMVALAPPQLAWMIERGLRWLWDRIAHLALAYSTTARNNRMNQVRDAIDGGAGAGLWRIYDGARPATCGTATTLLAELTCSDPCAAAAASGVMTFSAITADASANATGTATWFRIVDSTGTCCVDGNVGTAGSDLNLNSTSISTGQQVSITSATITEGNA